MNMSVIVIADNVICHMRRGSLEREMWVDVDREGKIVSMSMSMRSYHGVIMDR